MSGGVNQAQIIGNLGAAPEMRYTANGAAVASFNVACNRTYTDSNGERQEDTQWFTVVCWQKLAETVAQYLDKGRKVFVQGRMQNRSWEGQDGVKRYKMEIVASEVVFLDRIESNDPGPPAPDAPPQEEEG